MRRSIISDKKKQPKEIISNEERSKRYIEGLQQKMTELFENGNMQVSREKKPYLSQRQKEQVEDKTFKRIQLEKKRAQQKLITIQQSQRQYIAKHGIKVQKNQVLSRVRSQITQQSVQNTKKLMKQRKEFEKNIEERAKKIQQNRQKKILQQKLQRQKILKQKNDKKKEEITKRLQKLQKNNKQRQKRYIQEKQQIERIRSKKKLFQLYDENWKEKSNQQQQKKWQLMKNRLKNNQIDLNTLKQHQKKYQTIISQKKKQLHKKRIQGSRNRNQLNVQISKFYNSVIQQDQKSKEIAEQKRQAKKAYRNKLLQYSQHVRNNHQPKVKVNSQTSEDNTPKIPRITKQEQNLLGLQNLKYGKSKAKRKEHKTVDFSFQQTRTNASKYKDYLTQTRTRKQKQSNKSQYNTQIYNKPLFQAQKIMKNSQIQRKERVARVKLLADKIDNSSVDVVKKVAGKLQILEIMS